MNGLAASSHTAVIIGGDPLIRDQLDEVLAGAGFRTVVAGGGFEGLAAVKEHKPVITTVDMNLPDICGFEAARRIRTLSDTYSSCSAPAGESHVVLGLTFGADDYVTKPLRPLELRARVEAFMRRPRRAERPDGGETPQAEAHSVATANLEG